jgi:hypothetical protein
LLDEAHSGSKEDNNVATRLANAVCDGLKQHGGNERFASSCFQVHNCVLLFCLLQHFQLITTKTQINSTHPPKKPTRKKNTSIIHACIHAAKEEPTTDRPIPTNDRVVVGEFLQSPVQAKDWIFLQFAEEKMGL